MAQTNVYGFDFLKSEHQLDDGDDAPPRPSLSSTDNFSSRSSLTLETPDFAAVRRMTVNEKMFTIFNFLKAHRSAGFLAPSVIFKATGIDLVERDAAVAKELEVKENIAVEQVPDPENPSLMISTYAYQSKFSNVRDGKTLLAQINRSKHGVRMKFLEDTYEGATNDMWDLITAGDIIAIESKEAKDKILFPRGEPFIVELDGIVTVRNGITTLTNGAVEAPTTSKPLTDDEVVAAAIQRNKSNAQMQQNYLVEIDVDPTIQIRRGEAICVGGQWFRVSSAVQDGPLSEQPVRAQAPLSVLANTTLDKRNEIDGYIRPFTEKVVPLDRPIAPKTRENLQNAKNARDQLHKLAGIRGLSGGVAAQLLSPLASSSNPTTLASSFATGGGALSRNKRPGASAKSSHVQSEQAKKDAEAAQKAATDPSLAAYTHARRHGCTVDVREMYLATRHHVPLDEEEFHKKLLDHKLLEPGEAIRRPRLARKPNVDNDGKPKKRRYYERKNQRITNVHLIGTEIGGILSAAAEKQKQGKAVGDGGM